MTELTNYLFGTTLGMFTIWLTFSWRDVFSLYAKLSKKQIITLLIIIAVDSLALAMRFILGW